MDFGFKINQMRMKELDKKRNVPIIINHEIKNIRLIFKKIDHLDSGMFEIHVSYQISVVVVPELISFLRPYLTFLNG